MQYIATLPNIALSPVHLIETTPKFVALFSQDCDVMRVDESFHRNIPCMSGEGDVVLYMNDGAEYKYYKVHTGYSIVIMEWTVI
jgi:hypothetical protein